MQPKSVKFMNGLLNKFETATPRMPGWTTKKWEELKSGPKFKACFWAKKKDGTAKSFGLVSRTRKNRKLRGNGVQPKPKMNFQCCQLSAGRHRVGGEW